MPYRPHYADVRTLDGPRVVEPVLTHVEYEPPCDHLGHLEPRGPDYYRCMSCGKDLTELQVEAMYHYQRERNDG